MMERGHREAYRAAADKLFRAELDNSEEKAAEARTLMRAIVEVENHRAEVFSRLGIQDLPISDINTESIPNGTELGSLLAIYMDHQGLTQAELHNRSGVAQATIHNVLTGKTKRAEINTVHRLIRGLGFDPEGEDAKLMIEKAIVSAKPKEA